MKKFLLTAILASLLSSACVKGQFKIARRDAAPEAPAEEKPKEAALVAVTNFVVTPGDKKNVLTWSHDDVGHKYIVLRSTKSAMTAPAAGTEYKVNSVIGDATIVYIGSDKTFTDTGLTNNVKYFYAIYVADAGFTYSTAVAADGRPRNALRMWQTPQLLETVNTGAAADPDVETDKDGNIMTVWYQTNGTRYSAYAARYTPLGGWEPRVALETDETGHAYAPDVAFLSNNDAVAVWYQTITPDTSSLYGAYYTAATNSWGAPQLLENHAPACYVPRLRADSLGNAMAIVHCNGDVLAVRYTSGSGWSSHVVIDGAAGATNDVDVALDGYGNAVATWVHTDGTRYNVWVNYYTINVGWGAAQLIETAAAGDSWYPQVRGDHLGNFIVTWSKHDGTRQNVWANRYKYGVGWLGPVLLENDNVGNAMYPNLAIDKNGNAVVSWQQNDGTRDNNWSSRYDRLSESWSTPILAETDNTGNSASGKVEMDPDNNACAIWPHHDGTRYNIWSACMSGTSWGAATLLDTENLGHATKARFVIDADGFMTAVWQQSDGVRTNIWAARFE